MAAHPWQLLTLCDGYGGTELALRSVAPVRTVCRVERDAYAAAVLVARMEETRLDLAPIWDDLCTFDGAAWRGRVDIVAAGFPCQPFSAAGKRAGVDDDRWLWPDIARIIADVRPGFVLVENVPQLVRHGLPEVLSDLAALRFDAEWGLYPASAVGAPHKRERLWLVAHADGHGLGRIGCGARSHDAHDSVEAMGDAGRSRRSEVTGSTPRHESADGRRTDRADVAHGPSENVADTDRQGRLARCAVREHGDAIANALGTFPPHRGDDDGWREWVAAGGPQPVVRRGADGPPVGLADALHLGGNGLVPQCAAEAWRQLIERAGW